VSSLAASVACYALLSLAPLVVFSVVVAGWLFGNQAARGEIAGQIGSVVGPDAAHAVEAIAFNARAPRAGILSSVVGLAVLIFGASGVFHELEFALNTIWGVAPNRGPGVIGVVLDRFFSFAMVLAVAFLLLVSLVLSAAISGAEKFAAGYLPGGGALWQMINLVVALAITAGLFALIFKAVPRVDVRWRDVWVGALVTAILFNAGKFLLGLYIGKSTITSPFGAAGSLVALVIWVYYSSQIVFLGAEFTKVRAERLGLPLKPKKNAVVVG
jgi:membrane protein